MNMEVFWKTTSLLLLLGQLLCWCCWLGKFFWQLPVLCYAINAVLLLSRGCLDSSTLSFDALFHRDLRNDMSTWQNRVTSWNLSVHEVFCLFLSPTQKILELGDLQLYIFINIPPYSFLLNIPPYHTLFFNILPPYSFFNIPPYSFF